MSEALLNRGTARRCWSCRKQATGTLGDDLFAPDILQLRRRKGRSGMQTWGLGLVRKSPQHRQYHNTGFLIIRAEALHGDLESRDAVYLFTRWWRRTGFRVWNRRHHTPGALISPCTRSPPDATAPTVNTDKVTRQRRSCRRAIYRRRFCLPHLGHWLFAE